MRRRVIDTTKWNPRRPPGKALDPSTRPGETLTTTPTEQALERQMAEREREEARQESRE